MPRAEWKVIKEIDISVPPTTKEQTAIAEILSDMNKEIEALERRRVKTLNRTKA